MFTASMINYTVDNETKMITASVDGIANDAVETFIKKLNKQNIILKDYNIDYVISIPDNDEIDDDNVEVVVTPSVTCRKYLLPDRLSAIAKYDPNDPNEYSEEHGKEIARRRLYNQYNNALKKALDNILEGVCTALIEMCKDIDLTKERIIRFDYYKFYNIYKSYLNL